MVNQQMTKKTSHYLENIPRWRRSLCDANNWDFKATLLYLIFFSYYIILLFI